MQETLKELRQAIIEKMEQVEYDIEIKRNCKDETTELEGKRKAYKSCIDKIEEFMEEENK